MLTAGLKKSTEPSVGSQTVQCAPGCIKASTGELQCMSQHAMRDALYDILLVLPSQMFSMLMHLL